MADIAAADVTATYFSNRVYSGMPSQVVALRVTARITVDPGTTDAYPTGGIPLSALFAGDLGALDCLLDPAFDIIQEGSAMLRKSITDFSIAFPATFIKTGTTAADCKLMVMRGGVPIGGAARTTYTAATISAANADSSINDSANAFPLFGVGEPLLITGFTGTLTNNEVGRVVTSTVSKIVLAKAGAAFVDDAAGESVSVSSLWATGSSFGEFPNSDITGDAGFAGDTDPYIELTLVGTPRNSAVEGRRVRA